MITQAVLNWFGDRLADVTSGLPAFSTELHDVLFDIPSLVGQVVTSVSALDPIVPMTQVQLAFTLVMSGLTVALGVKLIRIALSLVTGGGGS